MKTKHTPGPWRYGLTSDKKYYVDCGGNLPVICVQQYRGEHEANARLIAAAPDLLAACKLAVQALDDAGVLGQVHDMSGSHWDTYGDTLNDAIHKADPEWFSKPATKP